jgi:hypothetical protein
MHDRATFPTRNLSTKQHFHPKILTPSFPGGPRVPTEHLWAKSLFVRHITKALCLSVSVKFTSHENLVSILPAHWTWQHIFTCAGWTGRFAVGINHTHQPLMCEVVCPIKFGTLRIIEYVRNGAISDSCFIQPLQNSFGVIQKSIRLFWEDLRCLYLYTEGNEIVNS